MIGANVVSANGLRHVMFAFVDHFEPFSTSIPETRIWVDDYIDMACQHVDADGRHPIHSYFVFWDMKSDGEVVTIFIVSSIL